MLLASDKADVEIVHEWQYNNGYLDHANNADGWLDQVAYFFPYLQDDLYPHKFFLYTFSLFFIIHTFFLLFVFKLCFIFFVDNI